MNGRATTLITILGGMGTDDFGDEVDLQEVIAEHVPASLIERTRRVYNYSAERLDAIRYVAGRVEHGTPITTANRIRDERTGEVYIVDSVDSAQSFVRRNDLRLELTKVSAT